LSIEISFDNIFIVVYYPFAFARNIVLALICERKMFKAKLKTQLPRICFYGMFVFFSIIVVLVLRSASLIWIHDVGMIGYTSWSLFKRNLLISTILSAIQTPIMLLCAFIYFLIRQNLSLRHIAIATLLLCILDLFIRPIGIWTMSYQILGPTLIIGAIIIFPLFAWLILFLPFPDRNLENKYIQKIIPRRGKKTSIETVSPPTKETIN